MARPESEIEGELDAARKDWQAGRPGSLDRCRELEAELDAASAPAPKPKAKPKPKRPTSAK